MSNKSRVARTIRDAENLQNCHNILKSRGLPSNNEIFNQLERTHAQYEEKYAKLMKFTAKSKTATKTQARMSEWIEEQNRLQNIAIKLERSIRNCFETSIVTSPELTELHDLMHSMNDASNNRKINEREIISQIQQLKLMLNEVKKSITKQINSNSSSNGDAPSSSSASMATSIIAELLVKLRTSHSQNWNILGRQEDQYCKELGAIRNKIMNTMRNDVLTEQDNQLRLELHHIVKSCSTTDNGVDTAAVTDDLELELVINEWYDKISRLDIEHETSMKCKHLEKLTYCQELNMLNTNVDGTILEDVSEVFKLGGWKSDDHEVFTKIFKKAQVTGMLRKVMTDLMASQLPHIPLDEIMLHEEWYRKMKSISNKYKESEQVYVTSRADLIQEAKQAVLAFKEAQREKAINEAQLQASEQYRQQLHNKLEEMRIKKEQLDAIQQEEELRKLEANRLKEEHERELQLQQKAEKKQLLEQYHATQLEEQRVRQEQLAQEQEAREAEIKRLIELNKPKVAMRAQLLVEKEAKLLQKEAELQAEEEKRVALLMKLAEQVPYFEAIQNATSKLDHITASTKGHEYFKGEDLTRGHMPLNGFTDTTVIRDSRFRLASALREAGVHHSEAAKIAVQQYFPRPHLAIHGIV